MNVDPDVNYEELARSTDDFNGAQCKAVCVEAGLSHLYFRFIEQNIFTNIYPIKQDLFNCGKGIHLVLNSFNEHN